MLKGLTDSSIHNLQQGGNREHLNESVIMS